MSVFAGRFTGRSATVAGGASFASDFPTDRLYADIDRVLDAYHKIVADFTLSERAALFAGNAQRLYRI